MFAASSATTPPFSAARSLPTGSQPCYFSENDTSFGPVPSRVEVESAILELQRFMSGLPTTKSQVEGVHGQVHPHHSKMLQSAGFTKFSEAFAMMQAEPPLQNLVVSISCDKAVWEAILSNEAVHDLQWSLAAGNCEEIQVLSNACNEEKKVRYGEEAELAELILRWIMDFTKSKIVELVENFVSLINEVFRPAPNVRPSSDMLDEKVRSSLLLSVVILLVVVVARGQH